MSTFRKISLLLLLCSFVIKGTAQVNPDMVLNDRIHSVRFHMYGDQLTMPVYKLNSGDRLELHFDDFDSRVKAYYYTFQLCDYNWKPVNLSAFDFIKGFTQMRITNYRFSSIAFARYTHYQAILPETNAVPSKSGNYLLKVYLDGDTSKLAFTRSFLVLDPKASVMAQIVQPFTPQYFKTHQRLRFNVNVESMNAFNLNQQVKVTVLKNYRWDQAKMNVPPTFVRGATLEYNNEGNFVFPGGKEWRWLDLRSFRLLSDRVDSGRNNKTESVMYLKPDMDRSNQRYVFYQDFNGQYQCTTYETINPYWQGDYAVTNFSFIPPNNVAYTDADLYLTGQFTDYQNNENSKMHFNADKGVYEGQLNLKQGFYNYGYTLVDKKNPTLTKELEGDYWETENVYTVLVYFKGFADQYDQLIGIAKISTRLDRPGMSF
ncbi:MAG: DUF5103 domain-containing protein [Ferruginibacter sp.]